MISWEEEPIKKITKEKQLAVYKHPGFWQPMDTLAEKKLLNDLYEKDEAPGKFGNFNLIKLLPNNLHTRY